MIFKQLWDTAPMRTSKKLSLVLAIASAVIGAIGLQLLDFDRVVGAVLVSTSMFLSGMAIMLFSLGELPVTPEPKPKD